MAKRAALITLHGMGRTEPDYAKDVLTKLERRLDNDYARLHVGAVFYQGLLQPNEDRVWNLVQNQVGWDALRKFLLFGFADAAGLESSRTDRNGVYAKTQLCIAKELWKAWQELGRASRPLVVLAHSLGCQVMSCYFWDAQQTKFGGKARAGIWQDIASFAADITGGAALGDQELEFLRGESMHTIVTTGCNIPIFVAAHATDEIIPIQPNATFAWHNFYDRQDVLGWPLASLSTQYGNAVRDHPINAASGVWGWILKSWNPLAHGEYWGDKSVLKPLESFLRAALV
jgi:hypothetical protein